MFTELMERISGHLEQNLPFVAYRKPKNNMVSAVFQQDAKLHHLDDFTKSGFVFAPFDSDNPSILIPADKVESVSYDLKNETVAGAARVSSDDFEKLLHTTLVQKGIDVIAEGKFQKVVLSRKVEVDCLVSPLELFQRLLPIYENAFCYLWHHPKIGTWLGATPEILLKEENRLLTTMSLAGTQKYRGDANPKWGKKELKEQDLVTTYIVNALQDKVSDLKISERETVKAGNLLHLRTKLIGKIQKDNLSNIVGALHPTPAVCGMPMKATKKFILENENYDREYYTGFLGELNIKNELRRPPRRKNQEQRAYKTIKSATTLFVNLRCMQLNGKRATLYVGGGVTQDSDPEREWEETVAKTNTMLQVITSV